MCISTLAVLWANQAVISSKSHITSWAHKTSGGILRGLNPKELYLRSSYPRGTHIPVGLLQRRGCCFESFALGVASARSHNGGGGGGSIAPFYWDYHKRDKRKNRMSYIYTPDRRISIIRGGTGLNQETQVPGSSLTYISLHVSEVLSVQVHAMLLCDWSE